MSVGHWLGHSLHHGGSNQGGGGSLNHWGGGSIWKVVVEVIVSEWVSITSIVTSSVWSISTVSVVSQSVVTQPVAVVKSISISL